MSQTTRLHCYVQADYFHVLAALERVDPAAIAKSEGWDFTSVLLSAGKNLALDSADVNGGITLSETVYMTPPEEPTDYDLVTGRGLGGRVRDCVHAWIKKLSAGALADA